MLCLPCCFTTRLKTAEHQSLCQQRGKRAGHTERPRMSGDSHKHPLRLCSDVSERSKRSKSKKSHGFLRPCGVLADVRITGHDQLGWASIPALLECLSCVGKGWGLGCQWEGPDSWGSCVLAAVRLRTACAGFHELRACHPAPPQGQTRSPHTHFHLLKAHFKLLSSDSPIPKHILLGARVVHTPHKESAF